MQSLCPKEQKPALEAENMNAPSNSLKELSFDFPEHIIVSIVLLNIEVRRMDRIVRESCQETYPKQ